MDLLHSKFQALARYSSQFHICLRDPAFLRQIDDPRQTTTLIRSALQDGSPQVQGRVELVPVREDRGRSAPRGREAVVRSGHLGWWQHVCNMCII